MDKRLHSLTLLLAISMAAVRSSMDGIFSNPEIMEWKQNLAVSERSGKYSILSQAALKIPHIDQAISFLFLVRNKINFFFFYSTADCFLSGERVKISESSEFHQWDTHECATVEENICSNVTFEGTYSTHPEWFHLTFDDGYEESYRYIDLTACVDQGK